MKYFLWKAAIGPHPRLPLTSEEYRALNDAWTTVMALLRFEEEFDCVIQNYIELELGFLNTAMHFMVLQHEDLIEYRKVRLKFSRLLSNLLSACRSYLDHSPHHLKVLGGKTSGDFVAATHQAYDSEFAYRFMEALRNHAQHRGSPLHGTTFASRRVEREDEISYLQYSMWASISVSELREDKKFKRSILRELSENENVDVLAMCRIYVEKLGELHASIRKLMGDKVAEAKSLLRSALDRYDGETGETRVGVAFARSRTDRTVDHYQAIPEDVIGLFESLVSKNRHVINLRKRFVSSELLPERAGRSGKK